MRFFIFSLFLALLLPAALTAQTAATVTTADIDRYWEAFDSLAVVDTKEDSISVFQRLYLDRLTPGGRDFAEAREWSAERFVAVARHRSRFLASVRLNTLIAADLTDETEAIIARFRKIHAGFQPKGICYAVGIVNTGGTISDDYLLIGAEISGANKNSDFSEFDAGSNFVTVLANQPAPRENFRRIVAHEYVHTQQGRYRERSYKKAPLLYACLSEGMCDFIGELLVGSNINGVAKTYGDAHAAELWREFKAEMKTENADNWLYNYGNDTDRPADLGYYIGYEISKAYYEQTKNKQRAIADLLELRDPLKILRRSGYDPK